MARKLLLQQDDCAPDGATFFWHQVRSMYKLTLLDFHMNGKRSTTDYSISYTLGSYILESYNDAQYWHLYQILEKVATFSKKLTIFEAKDPRKIKNTNHPTWGAFDKMEEPDIFKEKIYLSIPYTGKEKESFEIATYVAGSLMKAGFIVYSPISHCHHMAKMCNMPTTWSFWKRVDTAFIDWCDIFMIAKVPGWDSSVGVEAEDQIAKDRGKIMAQCWEDSPAEIYMDGQTIQQRWFYQIGDQEREFLKVEGVCL